MAHVIASILKTGEVFIKNGLLLFFVSNKRLASCSFSPSSSKLKKESSKTLRFYVRHKALRLGQDSSQPRIPSEKFFKLGVLSVHCLVSWQYMVLIAD
jgi:hypothetical protein